MKQKTRTEQDTLVAIKLARLDNLLKQHRALIERLEDRILHLEEQIESDYRETRDALLEEDEEEDEDGNK